MDVTFQLDGDVLIENIGYDQLELDDMTPEESAVLNRQQDERWQHLGQMVFFVQELQRHHNNILQNAECVRMYLLNDYCSEIYETKLTRLLPPLNNPQSLNDKNWARFAAAINETNLSAVTSIIPPTSPSKVVSPDQLIGRAPFLYRCRSLKYVHLSCISEGVFQWAIDITTQRCRGCIW